MTIYSVSDAYKTAIRARTRTDRVTGTLTLTNGTVLNLDAADLMSGSLTLDNQCVTGEELAFGCAYLGQAALNLRTDLSRHAFYGAKLVLHYGLQLPGGRWETVPLGVYTVAEAERRALYVSIKAYDNILALQQKYDGTTMQGTAYALLGQIAAACGLTLGQTEAEIGALNPNAALVCQLSGADGLSTWRECAAAVAQLVGGFAAADRAGRLVLRTFAENPVDMVVCNYVYEHVEDNTSHTVNYRNVFPVNKVFTWEEIHKFLPSQNLLMHSVIYRSQLLRDCGLVLPKHTFYVDNIFVYQPLPSVKTLYYMDLDLYRYFIGRADQSVNEQVMVRRVDQQLRVTRIMLACPSPYDLPERQKNLASYMLNYLSMMVAISSVFLTISGTPESLEKKAQLWKELSEGDPRLYRRMKLFSVSAFTNLPGGLGNHLTVLLYRGVQKIYKFN